MKILIIAYYYPPQTYARIASLRPYSWGKYWSEMGHEVRVLTTYKGRNKEELEPFPNVKIEEISYSPFGSLRKKQSHNTIQFNSQEKSFLKNKIRQNLIFFQKELGFGTLLYGSNLWIFPAYFHSIKLYQSWSFDIVISTYGPPANHVLSSLIKCKYDKFWAADYRDLWGGHHYSKAKYLFSYLENIFEKKIITSADCLITVSSPLKNSLLSRFNLPTFIIENGFDDNPYKREQFTYKNQLILVYTGSFYPEKQNLCTLMMALSHLEKNLTPKIKIVLHTLSTNEISKLIEKYKVSDIIRNSSFIAREECLKLQASADLLIFLDWNEPNIKGILTGKIFEYMVAGTPVINIGCDDETDASRLITESGIGVNLGNDPQAIAAYLKRLLQGEKPYYQPNQSVIEKYSRKKLAEKMLEQILHYKNQSDSNRI
ncbi:MAG: glycosyltransferase [Snowella sp.]|nr:glycosyltransferase [Snowella sp.]